jgi:hypothetical protein
MPVRVAGKGSIYPLLDSCSLLKTISLNILPKELISGGVEKEEYSEKQGGRGRSTSKKSVIQMCYESQIVYFL